MTVHRGLVKLCTAVATDCDISYQAANAEQSPESVLKNVPKFTGKHLCQGLLFNNNKVEKEIDNLRSWETHVDRHARILVRYPLSHRPIFRYCNLKHYITNIKSLW